MWDVQSIIYVRKSVATVGWFGHCDYCRYGQSHPGRSVETNSKWGIKLPVYINNTLVWKHSFHLFDERFWCNWLGERHGGRVHVGTRLFYSVSQTQAIGMAFTKHGRISKLWSTANLTWSCLTKRNSSWTSLKWNHNVHPPLPPINALRMSHVWIPNLVLHAHTHHSTRCGCGATVVNQKCLQCQAYHNFVVKKTIIFAAPPIPIQKHEHMWRVWICCAVKL